MKHTLDWNRYIEKARQVVSEGCVLLENGSNVLPLTQGTRIAVFGRAQLNYYKSGTGSGGMVNVSSVTGILEGLHEDGSVVIDSVIEELYKEWGKDNPYEIGMGWGAEPDSQKEMPVADEVITCAAERNDAAILIIGRTAGEDRDISAGEGSWSLTSDELSLMKCVKAAFPKTVVILNTGNVIDMSFVKECGIDTLMYVWQGGMVGGLGIADVLTGKTSPSGRLTDTIAATLSDYPAYNDYGDPNHVIYNEDIYVGYRYFETAAKDKVLYPFGYGLSYTTFTLEPGETSVSCMNGIPSVTLRITVTNTGTRPGKETVQIYAGLPMGVLGKPARTLAAFRKTGLLQPLQKETLQLTVNLKDLASYDDLGTTGNLDCLVLEAGTYTFFAGTDVRNAVKVAETQITETITVRQLQDAFTPVQPLYRLKAVSDTSAETGISFKREEVPPAVPYQNRHRKENLAAVDEYVEKLLSEEGELSDTLRQLTDDDLACIIRGEGMGSPKVTPGTAAAFGGVSKHLAELGIPCGCCSDGPSGMRLDSGAEAFSLPSGTLQACTFNPELITELYTFTGWEMLYNKVDVLLGPGMNIRRYPLNGRNFEYYSEDPLITGIMASATIKGLHNAGVTGAMKHFCCNNQETGRQTLDATVSKRALREIYLKGYEMAVQNGADVIMTSYGSTNSMWAAGNYDLNTRILRDEWGFKGFVMTDWWASVNSEGCEPNKTNFAQMARAQNDVYMTSPDGALNLHGDNTAAELEAGTLTRNELIRNAANIIRFLNGTHAKKRLLSTDDTVEIINRGDTGSSTKPEDIETYEVGDGVTINASDADTSKGSSFVFTLAATTAGTGVHSFKLYGKVKPETGDAAQIPVGLSANGLSLASFTWNGSEKEITVKSKDLLLMTKYSVIKLTFVQSGLLLEKVEVRHV